MKHLVALAALALPSALPAFAGEPVSASHDGVSAPLQGTLDGTFETGAPSIVLIPGSGPTDRDGNNPLGVTSSSYRLLGEALAERGRSVIRIDKRGMFGSAAASANPNAVTVEDYVADVAAWSAMARGETGAACTWLMGHSEGTLVAMATAAADPEPYCGLLLIAPVGRPLGATIREQLARNPANAPLLPQVEEILQTLERGERYEGEMHPGLAGLFGPQVQDFVISLLSYDPAELLKAHSLPVLVVGGREDIQTPDADTLVLAAARQDARIVLVEGMTHALKLIEPGNLAQNRASYARPDQPVAPALVAAIDQFLQDKD